MLLCIMARPPSVHVPVAGAGSLVALGVPSVHTAGRTRHGVENIQPQFHESGGNMLPNLCQKVGSGRSQARAELVPPLGFED